MSDAVAVFDNDVGTDYEAPLATIPPLVGALANLCAALMRTGVDFEKYARLMASVQVVIDYDAERDPLALRWEGP